MKYKTELVIVIFCIGACGVVAFVLLQDSDQSQLVGGIMIIGALQPVIILNLRQILKYKKAIKNEQ